MSNLLKRHDKVSLIIHILTHWIALLMGTLL